MKIGDLVVNTYFYSTLYGKIGLVVGLERFSHGGISVEVAYDNQVCCLTIDVLEPVSKYFTSS